MSDKNFKVKNGIDAADKLTITNTSGINSLIEVNGAGGGQFTVTPYGGISTNAGFQSIGGPSYFGGYGGATAVVVNVTGASGQTGDLQRWTTFGGTILAKVDSTGSISATDLTLSGNLTVNGTTTNLNSTNLIIEDKNIIIADVATPTDTTADGAGITIKGATDKTFNWVQSTKSFTTSDPLIVDGTNSTTIPMLVKVPTNQTTNAFEVRDGQGYSMFKVTAPAGGTAYNNGSIWIRPWGTGNVAAMGTDSYQGFYFVSPATSSINFGTGGGGKAFEIVVNDTFNRYKIEGKGTGVAPIFTTAGNDTDVNMNIYPKGAGKIGINTTSPTGYVHIKSPDNATAALVLERADDGGTSDVFVVKTGSNTRFSLTNYGMVQTTAVAISNGQANTNIPLSVTNTLSTTIASIIKGASSQSANLTEWQNSSGTALSYIKSDGSFYVVGNSNTTWIAGPSTSGTNQIVSNGNDLAFSPFFDGLFAPANSSGRWRPVNDATSDLGASGQRWKDLYATSGILTNNSASKVGLIVKGAASQTADIQQWQNSAGASELAFSNAQATNNRLIFTDQKSWSIYWGANPILTTLDGNLRITPWASDRPVLIVRGLSGQTNSLQEWQNSAGTPLTYIDSTGKFTSTVDAVINQVRIGKGPGTGTSNMVFGYNALASNTTGSGNLAFGFGALQSNTTGSNNFVLGNNSLVNATTGDLNMALGGAIMYGLTTGYYNTGIGYNALNGATTGRENMGIGISALQALTTGAMNTAIGQGAGSSITTSNSNVFIGYNAGANETGSNKLYISNSNTSSPLIGGDFSSGTVTFNGVATIDGGGGATLSAIYTGALKNSATAYNFFSNVTGSSYATVVVKALSGQTTNLQEWQNNAGALRTSIGSDGSLFSNMYATFTNAGAGGGNAIYARTIYADSVPVAVRGAASQTANLTEWQNSAGTVLAKVDSNGSITAGTNLIVGNASMFYTGGNYYNATLSIATQGAGYSGIVIRGQASQTADLQQWQNSAGSVITKIASDGSLWAYNNMLTGRYLQSTGQTEPYLDFSSNKLTINSRNASYVGLVVQGAASQTANLQEWQDSAGTVLATMSSNGRMTLDWVTASVLRNNYIVNYSDNGPYFYMTSTNTSLVNRNTASNVIFTIKGMSGQTGDLQQWQNSAGTTLVKIAADGTTTFSGGYTSINQYGEILTTGSRPLGIGGTQFTNTVVSIQPTLANLVGIAVRGATSQSANLTEWQDSSGNVLANVTSSGRLRVTAEVIGTGAYLALGSNGGNSEVVYLGYNYDLSGTGGIVFNRAVRAPGAANQGLIIRGVTSQTANLQEWQNSAGTAVAWIDKDGNFINGNNAGVYNSITTTSLVANGGNIISTYGLYNNLPAQTNAGLAVKPWAANVIASVIRGYTSQTADLMQFQDTSGSVLTHINNIGRMTINSSTDAGGAALYVFQPNGGYGVRVQGTGTTGAAVWIDSVAGCVGEVIRGATSQTANLTEWQRSDGTVKTFIKNIGGSDNQLFGWLSTDAISGTYICPTGSTSSAISINSSTSVSFSAAIVAGSASTVGLIIKGAASQTADLQQWQNSAGTTLAYMSTNGHLVAQRVYAPDSLYVVANGGPGTVNIETYSAATIGVIIKGKTSQTASLQEWQGSNGTTIVKVDAYGQFYSYSGMYATGGGGIGAAIMAQTGAATIPAIIAKGYTSQTANLQEWQNSLGTVLASVTQDGDAKFRLVHVGTTINYGAMLNVNTLSAANIGVIVQGVTSQTGDLQQWRNNIGTVLAKVDASGNFTATSKSFDIEHPTKENMRLRYGSLEGPENGVYVRGTTTEKIIELPDYWVGLVDEKTITVNLTAVGISQNIHVRKIENNKVYIGGDLEKAFFTVYGERKDIDKLTVEY